MIQTTTVRNKPKAFAWSYSKIKNFETCPKRHYHYEVAKDVSEPEGESLQYGNAVHAALASALTDGELPNHFKNLQPWVNRVKEGGGKLLVEQNLAITSDFEKCEWFSKDAWCRAKTDVVKITGRVAMAVDWKTGKIVEDGSQLAIMAQCVFSHFPEVEAIRTEFIWLKEDATTRADFTRAKMVDVWKGLLPRVALLQNAHETQTFPPKPGGLCRRWCQVVSCPHHGQ
jgi:hypothetical protein